MTLIRCHSCRGFYPKLDSGCPDCGAAKRAVNVALGSQAWRSNLNAQAAMAANPRAQADQLGRSLAGRG